MLTPAPILLLSLFTLLAASAPLPQEGNQQFDLHNKSPSPTLAPLTASPTAAATAVPSTARDLSAAVAAEALKKNSKQPITGEDGTKLGMAAVMEGLGAATGALGALPVAGGLGGLGARDESSIQSQNKKRAPLVPGLDLLKKLPIGGLTNIGGRDTSKLEKRDALGGDLLAGLPVVGSLLGGGGKVKRGATAPHLSETDKPAEKREVKKKRADPFSGIKKIAAIVADVRGVTSKVKRGSFSKSIIDSTNAKLDSQLDSTLEDAERTVHPENTSFPPGLPVKTPQDALDKRTDSQDEEHRVEYVQEDVYEDVFPVPHPHEEHEKYEGLQNTYETHEELKRQPLDLAGALPTKDLVENVSGLKSAMDVVKSVSSAAKNRNS